MNNRLVKLEKLKESGKNTYLRDFPGRETIKSILRTSEVILKNDPSIFKVAGRISARRDHGENIFFDIFDQTGSIQLHAKGEYDNQKDHQTWLNIQECDLGDCVGVEGTLSQNPRGEPLLLISNWTLLAKALIEPPDKRHGITEPEVKYRHRERDLLSSANSRALFKTRAEIVFEIRKYLNERDFIEIETPILQPIYGGATARPFVTKHNALSQQFYLSISSELYLKRALVGGFDRVYAFSRCFRNEGISPEHNPEFTNLEIFETCKNGFQMNVLTEDLIKYLYNRFSISTEYQKKLITAMPASDWPLSRSSQTSDGTGPYAEAWELYINNMEIASGASDLNDPHEQEKRLKESENRSKRLEKDNFGLYPKSQIEYDPYDKNYIEALECGALPWAGVGIGIDRLVMLLTGKTNIKDVIMFPTLRQISADA